MEAEVKIKAKAEVVKCPCCDGNLTYQHTHNTDWYGKLIYYKCKTCGERIVNHRGELGIAAP